MKYAEQMKGLCVENDTISDELFLEYGVNRGLRDQNGKGILTGLTNISRVNGSKTVDGQRMPCEGELWYRGYRINTLIENMGEAFGYVIVIVFIAFIVIFIMDYVTLRKEKQWR